MKCRLLGKVITFDNNVVLESRMKGKLKRILEEKENEKGKFSICSWLWSFFVEKVKEDVLEINETASFMRWMIATYYGAENFTQENKERWIKRWGSKRISTWELAPLPDYSILNELTGEYEDIYEEDLSDSDSEIEESDSDVVNSDSDTEILASSDSNEESDSEKEEVDSNDKSDSDKESEGDKDENASESDSDEYKVQSVSTNDTSSEDEKVASQDEEKDEFSSNLKNLVQFSFSIEVEIAKSNEEMSNIAKSEKIYSELLNKMQICASKCGLNPAILTSLNVQCDPLILKGMYPDYSDDQVDLLIKVMKRIISRINEHNLLLSNIEMTLKSTEMSESEKVNQITNYFASRQL